MNEYTTTLGAAMQAQMQSMIDSGTGPGIPAILLQADSILPWIDLKGITSEADVVNMAKQGGSDYFNTYGMQFPTRSAADFTAAAVAWVTDAYLTEMISSVPNQPGPVVGLPGMNLNASLLDGQASSSGSADEKPSNTGWWIMGILGVAAVAAGAGYVISSRTEHARANPGRKYPYRLALIDAGHVYTDEYGDEKDYAKLESKAKAWVAKNEFNTAIIFNTDTGAKEHFARDAKWHKPSFGDLNKIKIIFRDKNLQLWGIPYRMRPNSNQQPADIKRAHDEWVPSFPERYGPKQVSISDWVWLGSPGWWGDMSKERQAQVQEFLAAQGDMVPQNWNEWSEI